MNSRLPEPVRFSDYAGPTAKRVAEPVGPRGIAKGKDCFKRIECQQRGSDGDYQPKRCFAATDHWRVGLFIAHKVAAQ